ncbi:MAG: tetratricopeptide repeat protein, partial [Porticoccaceae bacterium]|nr:tetratricopeptide repeat protein [Porticoccaceae bacterium]
MDWITLTASWFRENESVLSGIAALVAIVGILLSPLGGNIKALFSGAKSNTGVQQSPESKPLPSPDGASRPAGKPTIYIEPFTGSSEAASTLALELYEEVRRAVANFTGSTLVSDIKRASYIARVNVLLTGTHCRATVLMQDVHNNEDFQSERYEANIDNRLEAIDKLGALLSMAIRYGIAIHLTTQQGHDTQSLLSRMAMGIARSDENLYIEALAIAEGALGEYDNDSMFQAIYSRLLYATIRFDYHPLNNEQINKAELAARKAVALNDRSDFAHVCLGSYLLYAKGDFTGAKRSFLRSLEITPRYHLAHTGLGEIEIFSRDAGKGIDLCTQDLKSPILKNGRNHEAIAAGEIRLGNYEAALEMAEDAIHKYGEVTQTLIVLAAAAGLAGKGQIASHAVASLKERHPDITIDTMRRWPYKDDADW